MVSLVAYYTYKNGMLSMQLYVAYVSKHIHNP